MRGLSWELEDTEIRLSWPADVEKRQEAFDSLFAESYRTDDNGFAWLRPFGSPMGNPQHAKFLNDALLGTFLQHTQHRSCDAANKPTGKIVVEAEGEDGLHLTFRKISSYAHIDPSKRKYDPEKGIEVKGWLFPGAAERHFATSGTAFQEPAGRALALLFAPIGVFYFQIRAVTARGSKNRHALIVPQITNLKSYAQARKQFVRYPVQDFRAAGAAEAAYRTLVELHAAGLLEDVRSATCRAISMGNQAWNKQQKVRVHLMTVEGVSQESLRIFSFCMQVFQPKLVRPDSGTPFWTVPLTPALVAENLSGRRSWWEGFAQLLADSSRRDRVLGYARSRSKGPVLQMHEGEKGGLVQMVKDTTVFPEGPERTFVLACHEAWRRRMGRLSEKTRRQGSSFRDQVQREFEKIRVLFSRCKNAPTFRAAVVDFWTRAGGPIEPLQEGWGEVLSLLDDRNWRKGRDLALLALASYKPRTDEEQEAFEEPATDKDKQKEGRS